MSMTSPEHIGTTLDAAILALAGHVKTPDSVDDDLRMYQEWTHQHLDALNALHAALSDRLSDEERNAAVYGLTLGIRLFRLESAISETLQATETDIEQGAILTQDQTAT